MKTLDEVITELEDEGVFPDALHYLRAYRENQRTYEESSRKAEEARERYLEAVRNCERAENKYKQMREELGAQKLHMMWVDKHFKFEEPNDPLTWDELRQMDMQPVWYESLYWGVKTWAMVLVQKEGIYIDWYHRCQDGQIIKGNRCEIYKDQQGERWQAYRKERL